MVANLAPRSLTQKLATPIPALFTASMNSCRGLLAPKPVVVVFKLVLSRLSQSPPTVAGNVLLLVNAAAAPLFALLIVFSVTGVTGQPAAQAVVLVLNLDQGVLLQLLNMAARHARRLGRLVPAARLPALLIAC